jgi:hypothetical protein
MRHVESDRGRGLLLKADHSTDRSWISSLQRGLRPQPKRIRWRPDHAPDASSRRSLRGCLIALQWPSRRAVTWLTGRQSPLVSVLQDIRKLALGQSQDRVQGYHLVLLGLAGGVHIPVDVEAAKGRHIRSGMLVQPTQDTALMFQRRPQVSLVIGGRASLLVWRWFAFRGP